LWEAWKGRSWVKASTGQGKKKNSNVKNDWRCGSSGRVPALHEAQSSNHSTAKIKRKYHSKPNMVVHYCISIYLGERGKRTAVEDLPGKKVRPYVKNKLKAKGLEAWLKW
jgi:hypothetical protein